MLGKIEGRRKRQWQKMMVGWHHQPDRCEFEQALEVGDGQGSLVCCSSWGHKELDTTEWLNWNIRKWKFDIILMCVTKGCSLDRLMLKLKFQCFGHLMRRVDSLEKTLMLEGIGGRRRRGRQRMRWLDGITDLMDISLSMRWWRTGKSGLLQSMGSQRVEYNWVTEQQQ